MIAAVFSDVHGNLPALERFLSEVDGAVDSYVCLGDVVNYGPWSTECLELVTALPSLTFVRGNHEDIFLDLVPLDELSGLVRTFSEFCKRDFDRRDLVEGLRTEADVGRFRASHTIDGLRIFPETDAWYDHDHLIGHSHWQYAVRRGGLVINPGSIGQNRQRIDHLDFALVDVETGATEFKSIEYDVSPVMKEMKSRGYPREAIAYLESKRRTARSY